MCKANALRVLTKIIDDLYVQSLEKYLKQAIIDKSTHVVSASLVSLVSLYKKGGHGLDVVKKMVNELQDKLMNSPDGYVQYQALLILFELKKNDQMSVLKLLYQLSQTKVHSAIAKCQLIRYIKMTLLQNPQIDQRSVKTFLAYIESCLATSNDDAVQFEAAKTMCELFEIFGPVVSIETSFSVLVNQATNSQKPVNKYAALRVMNRIASKQPALVGNCQTELENLITDMNRSVASLAISTLLKTCNEDSVQKLLKQISHYLPDLGLDFKIETIQSTALLYHRLP
jgi:coatomer protein complex subunit gamma